MSCPASLSAPLGLSFRIVVVAVGSAMLLWPALRLARTRNGRHAARLFDLASLYPLALLLVVLGFVIVR